MTVMRCCHCHEVKDISEFTTAPSMKGGIYKACRKCEAEHSKAYRQTPAGREKNRRNVTKWRLVHPERRQAQSIVRDALRKGIIARPLFCERCMAPGRLHAHHADYTKPLEVEWLCPQCHSNESFQLVPSEI